MKVVLNALYDNEVFEFILDFQMIPSIGDKIRLDSDTYGEYEKSIMGCEDTFIVGEVYYIMKGHSLDYFYIVADFDKS